MTDDSVPWMVGGGAKHSAEVGRVLAYAAFRGNEGVMGPGDLKVSARSVPDGSVEIAPGAFSILCRASGQSYQMYAGRVPSLEALTIAPTGGSPRSDMVVRRVEDPWISGEGWEEPLDPAVGPYHFPRVISGVPSTAKTVAELGLGYSAIACARIDIPASTGTITQAMITDLRKVANPRREVVIDHRPASGVDALNTASPTYEQFPDGVAYTVAIPSWAVVAKVSGFVEGLRLKSAGVGGIRVGFAGTAYATSVTSINEAQYISGGYDRRTYNVGGTIAIPASLRGTTQTIEVQGNYASGSGFLESDAYSSGLIQIQFEEAAA